MGTILNALIIAFMIDFSLPLLPYPETLVLQLLQSAVGVLVVGVASGIYLAANLGAGPLTGNPQQNIGQPASGIWSVEEKQLSITHLELKAVKELIVHFRSQLRGKVLLVWEDNQGVVGILRKLCARSQVMRDDLHEIMELLEELDLILRVRYVASAANPSDYFSRVRTRASGCWIGTFSHE